MDPSSHRGSPSRPLPSINDSNDDLSPHRVRFAEGEPQTSYKIPQPPASAAHRERLRDSGSGPEVYWDDRISGRDIDRESDANLVGYTFYREPTPPPPGSDVSEKRTGYGAAPGGLAGSAGGGVSGSDPNLSLGQTDQNEAGGWSLASSHGMSPETKKKFLWVVVVIGVLVIIGIAVGVGVGLGVGVSRGNVTAVAATNAPSSSLPAPLSDLGPNPTGDATDAAAMPTASPTASGTAGVVQATSAAGRPTYNSDCPALNNTIYHVPGSTKRFLRYCGIDYGGAGATDLAHAWTTSMAECMHTCASFNECTACAWGYIPGDDGEKHRCYMKKDLKKSHQAAIDWCFAILLP